MAENHKSVIGSRLDARLWGSVALNLAITLVEFAGGLWGGSVALLADSAHNLADAGAVGLAIFARRLSRRAPTPRHTYGFKRAEVIAALLNSAACYYLSRGPRSRRRGDWPAGLRLARLSRLARAINLGRLSRSDRLSGRAGSVGYVRTNWHVGAMLGLLSRCVCLRDCGFLLARLT